MGCAVMLATTLARPYPSTFITHPVQLPGGGAELLRRPTSNTVDPTDLIALVMLGVAVWDARRLMQRGRAR